MQLPLEVLFEPPTRNELRRALRPACVVAATAALLMLVVIAARAKLGSPVQAGVVGGYGTLRLASVPPGAAIEIDGQQSGRTPMELTVAPGPHRVRLHSPGHASAAYDIDLPEGGRLTLKAE